MKLFLILAAVLSLNIYAQIDRDLITKLNSPSLTSDQLDTIINNWPDDLPIWDQITLKQNKLKFISLILSRDNTNERDYYSFKNLCTGFSAQMFVRYSIYSTLNQDELDWLKDAGVENLAESNKKLKIPLFMVTYPGHAFNAVLIDQNRPELATSYIFFEPQNDNIFLENSSSYNHYLTTKPIDISVLLGFSAQGVYNIQDQYSFFYGGDRVFHQIDYKMKRVITSMLIGSTELMNYNYYLKGKSFQEYVLQSSIDMRLTRDQLEKIIAIMRLKTFKEHPNEDLKIFTDSYLRSLFQI